MTKKNVAKIVIILGIFVTLALYLVRPGFFHRLSWHVKKTTQLLYMHEIKKLDIPLISQTKNLNCEAATATMILNYYGKNTTIDEVQNALPLNPNPHKGFRGSVDGKIWGYQDYGVYAEPIAKVMSDFGVASKSYTNISEDFLKQKIFEGKPAIIWVVISNPKPIKKTIVVENEKVDLVSGEHVAVVTGYENGTWILNDPWRTTDDNGNRIGQTLYVEDLDSIKWNEFNHMAVIVE